MTKTSTNGEPVKTVADIDKQIAALQALRAGTETSESIKTAFAAVDTESPTVEADRITQLCRTAGMAIEKRLNAKLAEGREGWFDADFDAAAKAVEKINEGNFLDGAIYALMAQAHAATRT